MCYTGIEMGEYMHIYTRIHTCVVVFMYDII